MPSAPGRPRIRVSRTKKAQEHLKLYYPPRPLPWAISAWLIIALIGTLIAFRARIASWILLHISKHGGVRLLSLMKGLNARG